MLEQQLKDLEKKIKDKDIEIDDLKADIKEKDIKINKLKTDNTEKDIEIKEKDIKIDKLKTNNTEINIENIKKDVEIGGLNYDLKKFKEACIKIISNDILYFNMYDYIDDDIDPQRFVRSSDFNRYFDTNRENDKIKNNLEKFIQNDKEKSKYLIIKDNMMEALDGYLNINNSRIGEFIDEDLSKKPRYESSDKLMERLDWIIDQYQVRACHEILFKFKDSYTKIQAVLLKAFDFNNTADDYYDELEKESYKNHKVLVDATVEFIQLLNRNIIVLSTISQYASRCVGAAEQAILVLDLAIGK